MVVEPPAVPVAPAPRTTGIGVLGGAAVVPLSAEAGDDAPLVIVEGQPLEARLDRLDAARANLHVERGLGPIRRSILLVEPDGSHERTPGADRVEVVIDGWRVEVDVESERQASLRERARRGSEETHRGGPLEVHAIIPGQVVSVSVVAGDDVVAGQQLLVVEAMKMQNELRAPRDGRIIRVAVAPGKKIEVGDLLLVID